MDSITSLIKSEIKSQYKSVSEFSKISGIPYSTLSNALSKGVGGTSYDTVVKICKLLNIKQSYDNDVVLFSEKYYDIYSKLSVIDEQGLYTVCAVLNAEYNRCLGNDEPVIKAFNGIGIAGLNDKNEAVKKL